MSTQINSYNRSNLQPVSSTRERYETTSSTRQVVGGSTQQIGTSRTIGTTGSYRQTGTVRTTPTETTRTVQATSRSGLVNDEERNMIAESMAKIALLTMENNRLKMKYAQAQRALAQNGIHI